MRNEAQAILDDVLADVSSIEGALAVTISIVILQAQAGSRDALTRCRYTFFRRLETEAFRAQDLQSAECFTPQ